MIDSKHTPASSAPGGEAVKLTDEVIVEIYNRVQGRWSNFGGPLNAIYKFARSIESAILAHPAAAPDSAQQGEDEPPLPEPDAESSATGERWYTANAVRKAQHTYHAHMMRKLGDGAYRERVEEYAKRCGWKPNGDEGAIEYVSRASYERGQQDERAAGAERAVPEGWKLVPVEPMPTMCAKGFVVSEAEHDPAGVYRAMLAAAPSPAQVAQEGEAVEGCPKCGCTGIHACPGAPIPPWTPAKIAEFDRILSEYESEPAQQTSAKVDAEGGEA